MSSLNPRILYPTQGKVDAYSVKSVQELRLIQSIDLVHPWLAMVEVIALLLKLLFSLSNPYR